MRRIITALAASAMLVGLGASTAIADNLPANCERYKGTVTCKTTEGPGKNQAGVGNTVDDDTKGNTKNKNPEPQELRDDECVEQNPEKSRGKPIAC